MNTLLELLALYWYRGGRDIPGFYLTAVDAQVKAVEDAPTIGLLLCKNKVVAEYALCNGNKPMGAAEYQLVLKLVHSLPAQLETRCRWIGNQLGILLSVALAAARSKAQAGSPKRARINPGLSRKARLDSSLGSTGTSVVAGARPSSGL